MSETEDSTDMTSLCDANCCIFGRPNGPGHNGPCSCFDDMRRVDTVTIRRRIIEMRHKIAGVTKERDEARDGYHALDRNWSTVHEAAMGPIRSALGLPDATVAEIVAAIERVTKERDELRARLAIAIELAEDTIGYVEDHWVCKYCADWKERLAKAKGEKCPIGATSSGLKDPRFIQEDGSYITSAYKKI